MKKNSGFTLIELMIVVAIIAIIAAIAIPNLLRSRMSANEASAIGAMRTLSSSEVMFQTGAFADADGDGIGDFGTLAQLGDPDGTGNTATAFIDTTLAAGTKQGYTFVAAPVPGTNVTPPAYTITATPLASGRTGYRTFFVDESGVIRFMADGTAAGAASPPLS